jgi:hypothetical protein
MSQVCDVFKTLVCSLTSRYNHGRWGKTTFSGVCLSLKGKFEIFQVDRPLNSARTFMRMNDGAIRLVVVDEPSAAMDPAGEYKLFKHLREARQGKTMIFITHRFGHLTKHADLILCMKEGKLVEQGTHAELVAQKGEYFELYNVQAQAFVTETQSGSSSSETESKGT